MKTFINVKSAIPTSLLVLVAFFSGDLIANEELSVNEAALAVSQNLASSYPQKISKYITAIAAYSLDATVVVVAEYDAEKDGLDVEEMVRKKDLVSAEMKKFNVYNVCNDKSTKVFVAMGGSLMYKYRLPDGRVVIEYLINQSDCES